MGLMERMVLIHRDLGNILHRDAEKEVPFSTGKQRPDPGAEYLGDLGEGGYRIGNLFQIGGGVPSTDFIGKPPEEKMLNIMCPSNKIE